ncbi:MAG: Lipid A biosynthesis lauroyl acyltransferase (EC [uncultured Sulfurovum sp.]|uniref:Lipid A biosynthesis lauroyl acyltransferase (EC) n=1 Tax=uncultured Sulfurovum sp. TaxID=269237 RepID=A0A6S6T7W4_9BACT|nr:MAG: Lipid A biosynthesis lauroyl acyltransferase (EC [uncultured Sulfurovum sp.]
MQAISWFAYTVSAKHRRIIHTNLDLAFKNTLTQEEKKAYGVSAFINLLDTTLGIIKRDGMKKSDVIKNITFEGEDIVKQYQDAGKKIIFVTGHQGNWELLSQSIAIKFDLTLVGVGRKLDSDLMDKVLKENRERFNVEMVYKKGAMKGCIKALSQNKAVGILVDQSIRQNQSITVNFFNTPATHTPLASILSRKFDIDLIPVFISTNDYINYHVKIYPAIESIKTDNQEKNLAKLTQAQADVMEKIIKENPKEWFWMHKRWKEFNPELYR